MKTAQKTKTEKPRLRALVKKAAPQLACGALGLLLSGVTVGEDLAPFGLSFAGGADAACTVASSVGAAAGYLLFRDIPGALKTVSAAALVCFIKTGAAKAFAGGRQIYLNCGCVFLSFFVCSLIVASADGLTVASSLLALCEAVVAAAGACFFTRVFALFRQGRGVKSVSTADFAALLFAGASLALSLNRLPVAGASLAHAAAGFCVMLLALCGAEQAPVMAGVCFGVTMGLGGLRPQFLTAFPLAGLLCGVCGAYGKGAVAAAFAVADLLALMLRGGAETALLSAGETAATVLLFLVIPGRQLVAAVTELLPARADQGALEQRRLMEYRLKTAAKAVRDVGASVKKVSDLLVKTEAPDPSYIPESVRTERCSGCLKREFCWDRTGKLTEAALRETYGTLMKNGGVTEETLPLRLQTVCREKPALCAAFNRLYCEYQARLTVRQELLESKELAAVQFSGASAVLEDAAKSLSAQERADPRTAFAAREALEEFGFSADPVLAFSDSRGRSTVEAFCSVVPREADYAALTERLYEKTGFSYLDPVTDAYAERGAVLSFSEAADLTAQVHVAVRVGAGETVCGDACRSFTDAHGNFYVVLSDGMGRGKRAALDSAMVCALTARLVRTGFSLECAVGAVNTALMMRATEETLATLDILRVDLTEGKAEFFKAGAALSVARTGEKTAVIERSSLPLGILQEIRMERSAVTLAPGDRVLLMSDGAAVLPPQHFRALFARMKKKSIKELAETAADEAMKYSPSGKHDDITVACVEIEG